MARAAAETAVEAMAEVEAVAVTVARVASAALVEAVVARIPVSVRNPCNPKRSYMPSTPSHRLRHRNRHPKDTNSGCDRQHTCRCLRQAAVVATATEVLPPVFRYNEAHKSSIRCSRYNRNRSNTRCSGTGPGLRHNRSKLCTTSLHSSRSCCMTCRGSSRGSSRADGREERA